MDETVKELAECCICTNLFTDPRILPCIHTFCLNCITKISTNAQLGSGDSMECPYCRTPFVIPKAGMPGLKKNFFMERVVEMAKLAMHSSNTMIYCEICMEDVEESAAVIPEAKQYCIQCQKNICDHCCQEHKVYKMHKSHQLVPLGMPLMKEFQTKFSQQICNEHEDEEAKLFCLDCKEPICMNCFAVKHKLHHCSNIEAEGDKIREEIKDDVKLLKDLSQEASGKIKMLTQSQMDFKCQLENVEEAVIRRSNEMKELIDDCTQALLNEAALIKEQKSKQLETEKEEIKRYKASLDNFESYSTELICKGSSAEICQNAAQLHRKSEELRKTQADLKIHTIEVFFDVSNVCDFSKDQNVVGSIIAVNTEANEGAKTTDQDIFAKYLEIPEMLKSITIGGAVWGLALLNNKLFVVSIGTDVLLIYESVSLEPLQSVRVNRLHRPQDIASCESNKCIFILAESAIYCLDSDGKLLKRWMLPLDHHYISTTPSGTLLVAYNAKILEYNSEGELLQNISLQQEAFDMTWHSVLTDSGYFHVCQGWRSSKHHRVLIVNAKGKILRSYGSAAGSSKNSLHGPVCLTVDKDGFIFVADSFNRRIVLLSPTLAQSKCLITSRNRASKAKPYKITLNESTGMLYVGTDKGDIQMFKVFV